MTTKFRHHTATVLLITLAAAAHAGAVESTWESPPATTQLDMDGTIVPIGKGAVFVPSMTNPDNEPVYGVMREGDLVGESRTGKRITLAPGEYTVIYGSGTVDQLMRKRVRVVEGATTLIKPDWSGLVIDVMNESRTRIREYYEILDMNTGESYGMGQGIEQGLDEQLRTWILPPGTYKIVKPGGNINDVINFGTIRLSPGELAHAILVIDSKSMNFLGFGYRTDIRQFLRRDRKWTRSSELAGNALLNYIPTNESGAESDASFTSTVQWLTDARYENGRHVVPIWANLEQGLSMDDDRELRKYVDKAELKLTYIYRWRRFINPYLRGAVETRLFETSHRFEEPTDFVELTADGDTARYVEDAESVRLGKPFSPVYLKEGFGLNTTIVKSLPVNFNLRSGYGARQTYARDSFLLNTDTNVLVPIQETNITGIEFLLLGDIRIGRYILFDTEFDILMPERDTDTWIFDGENRLRINLTSHVSLLLTMEYWRYENIQTTQTRYQTLLRFSKFM